MNKIAEYSPASKTRFVASEIINRDQVRAGGSIISDDEFLGELEKHKDAFYRFVKRTTLNQAHVDDIFSSAILASYENRHKFTPGTNFRAWMYRILMNKCFVANRDTARTRPMSDWEEPAQPNHHPSVSWHSFYDLDEVLEECGDEVHDAFQRLSFPQRVCLLLRVVEQLSYREIAEVVEIPIGTVTTHLARARGKLRAELQDYAQQYGLAKAVQH